MRQPDLEIDLLRAFVAVAETGSFTLAADIIGRSQSAVSQKVLRLEEILQLRVFERSSRSLSLTRDGERMLVSARRMLELNDAILREMTEPPASGSIRLGVSEDFVPLQLPRLLASFGRLYPGVHLHLMTGLTDDLLAAYDEGKLDAVISKKDAKLHRGRVIWREPLVWICASDHNPDPSLPARLVLLKPPCSYRDIMVAELDMIRREWVAVCTASSLMGVQAAVAGGLGVTVLAGSFVQDGLRILNPTEQWPTLPMTEIAVLGEDSDKGHIVRALVAFLTENLTGKRGPLIAA